MPLAHAFIVLPFVLNARMRDSLPTLKTMMSTWVATHPEHVAEFGDRARGMADVTREAIQFGHSQSWLAISGHGLSTGAAKLRPDPQSFLPTPSMFVPAMPPRDSSAVVA